MLFFNRLNIKFLYSKFMFFSTYAISIFSLTLLLASLFFLTSCAKTVNDDTHPLFIKAQNCFKKGDYTNANILYKNYLKLKPDSAKANYNLAVIYQEQREYIQAIFYYEKYLALEPDSSDKKIIEKWINSSKKQLYKELEKKYTVPVHKLSGPNKTVKPDLEYEKKLLNELNLLKTKNEKMRNFILRHKKTIYSENKTGTDRKATNNIIVHENNQTKFYTIKPGDTLYGISKKFYGTARFYKFLLEKNRKLLNSSTKLVPGKKLIIPPKPEGVEL